jgi:predicted regulator of Ras-like GTPase activity (Roadblock/LC7/MglB family)
MALRPLLQELILDDARAAAVGGMDGTLVEAVVKEGGVDLGRMAADLATLMKLGAFCARKLDGGDLDAVSVTMDRLALLVMALTPEHFVAVVLRAGGNVARARLAVKKRRSELVEQLT